MDKQQLRAAIRAIQALPIRQGAKDIAIARLVEAHLPDRHDLDHQGGSVKDTAKVLGIQRTYLSRLISKYGLNTRRGR